MKPDPVKAEKKALLIEVIGVCTILGEALAKSEADSFTIWLAMTLTRWAVESDMREAYRSFPKPPTPSFDDFLESLHGIAKDIDQGIKQAAEEVAPGYRKLNPAQRSRLAQLAASSKKDLPRA